MTEAGPAAPLPWQIEEWNSLSSRIASGRLHHGLLLSGPAGIGKRLLAEKLALALLCATPSDGAGCGTCKACKLAVAGSHPDWLRVEPEEPGKQIRIARVRDELLDFVMRTPSISQRKVVLIDPADAMNTATANCLLKSLEEPASGTHLLLVSDAPVRLLPTIRSRCEHLRMRPPAWDEALGWLRAVRGEDGTDDLLGAASGCPLAALRLGQGNGLLPFDRIAAVMCRAVEAPAWAVSLAAECADLELREVMRWIQIFLIDLQRWHADRSTARLPRAVPVYNRIAPGLDARHLARTLERAIAAGRDALSTANPNRQLLLESLLISWSGVVAD